MADNMTEHKATSQIELPAIIIFLELDMSLHNRLFIFKVNQNAILSFCA